MFKLIRQQLSRYGHFFAAILLLQVLPSSITYAAVENPPFRKNINKGYGNKYIKEGENPKVSSVVITVQGLVTGQNAGESLPGVSVYVKGSTTGTITNAEGKYTIEVPDNNATLVFSFIGYIAQEVVVNNQTTINVVLQEDFKALDEVVVTGYSTERVVDLTGSVSVVDTKALANRATNNPMQSLQGQVPGVFITTDGNPSGNAQVRVRGVSTLNNNDPLYVIDGVPTKSSAFDVLNPNDIESIQVLKDASSAAIYGARASNGVIIVTTKHAKGEGLKVNYSTSITHSAYTSKPSVLNTEQRARVQWQATVNDGLDPDKIQNVKYEWHRNPDGTAVLDNVIIPEFIVPGVRAANTNWFDEISRSGLIQDHNISMSTSGEKGGAFLSLRYFDNKYLLKYRDYEKLSVRVNSNYNFLKGKVKIGQNLVISNGTDNGFNGLTPLERALEVRTMLPVRTEAGGYSGPISGDFVDSPNPVMILDYNQWDQRKDVNLFGNMYANISLLENLTFNANLGIDRSNNHARDIERRYSTGFITRSINSLRNLNGEEFNWNLNSTLQYNLKSKDHTTSFLVGAEAIRNQYEESFAYKEDFAIETLDYFVEEAGSGRQTGGGTRNGFALLSYFGKANYSY